MTLAGIVQLLDVIRPLGRRIAAVLELFKGEAVAGHIHFERARVLLHEALGQCTVSEVVLDATNQLRFVFARAVLKGLEKCRGAVVDAAGMELFLSHANRVLGVELRKYFFLSTAVGAKDLVIAVDGMKAEVGLLRKGRPHLNINEHEKNKIARFQSDCEVMLKAGQSSAYLTSSEASRRVAQLVAELLHTTAAGHALTELLLVGAVDLLRSDFPSLAVHLCVAREADFLCLNGSFTFRDGVVVPRSETANVVVITHDADLATQIPFGMGCRSRKFFQIVLNNGDVCVREPEDLFRAVLEKISAGFVERVGNVKSLFLEDIALGAEHVSVGQKICLFFMLLIGANDYTFSSNRFLVDGQGRLPTEDLFLVCRAFAAVCLNHVEKGMVADVSLSHLIWVANPESGFSIAKLDSSPAQAKRRARLYEALNTTSNQVEWFYQSLSRIVTMFPRLEERQSVMSILLSFFPREKLVPLYDAFNPSWLASAFELKFSFASLQVDRELAVEFLRAHFPPRQKRPWQQFALAAHRYGFFALPVSAVLRIFHHLGGRSGSSSFCDEHWAEYFAVFGASKPTTVPLKWGSVAAFGRFGPGTEPVSLVPKKKASLAVRGMSQGGFLPPVSLYSDCEGRNIAVEMVEQSLAQFYNSLVANELLRASLIALLGDLSSSSPMEVARRAKHLNVPVFAPFSSSDAKGAVCVVGQLAKVGVPFTRGTASGRVLEILLEKAQLHLPNSEKIVCLGAVLEPSTKVSCRCGGVLFDGTSWHRYAGECHGAGFCSGGVESEMGVGDADDHFGIAPMNVERTLCVTCAHVDKCVACRNCRVCPTCRASNNAVFASSAIALYLLVRTFDFSFGLSVGSGAQDALVLALQGDPPVNLSSANVRLVEESVGGFDPSQGQLEAFFESSCLALVSLWAERGAGGPVLLSPNERIHLYDTWRSNIKGFPKIGSLELIKELDAGAEKGKTAWCWWNWGFDGRKWTKRKQFQDSAVQAFF